MASIAPVDWPPSPHTSTSNGRRHKPAASRASSSAARPGKRASHETVASNSRSYGYHTRAQSGSSGSSADDDDDYGTGAVPWPAKSATFRSRGRASKSSVHDWLRDTEVSAISSRTPPRTLPSADSVSWEEHSYLAPSLRASASSTSHFSTPPRTPTDGSYFSSYRVSPVVVAAPIADVGTMDALVDGMNGIGSDDLSRPTSHRHGSRSSLNKSAYDLYQPPLPTPPPGIVLSGKLSRQSSFASHLEEEEDLPPARPQRKHKSRSRTESVSSTATDVPRLTGIRFPTSPDPAPNPSIDEILQKHSGTKPKTVTPSISDIIRKHVSPNANLRGRRTPQLSREPSFIGSTKHSIIPEEREDTRVPFPEGDIISRSSVDSIAAEVQNSLRVHTERETTPQLPPQTPRLRRASIYSDGMRSIGSGSGSRNRAPSTISGMSLRERGDEEEAPPIPTRLQPDDPIVSYLRSTRITTLLRLTRCPHASARHPLTVSLCDLGDENGHPLVIFLGLGCVRHLLGLYDEMAQLLGLRLIAVDRWGLGRTETPHEKQPRGIPEWSSVIEEVLDHLHIDRFSVMAHSAGAPYALSLANRLSSRVQGDICLLAPWVGGSENSGYKWLKYVPNGILKTAQAAEWKLQAWMLGKPPTVVYRGIGFDVNAPLASSPPVGSTAARPSFGSGGFSDYDDLNDFNGCFDSRSTLGARPSTSSRERERGSKDSKPPASSMGFFNRFRRTSSSKKTPAPSGAKSRTPSITSPKSRSASLVSAQAPVVDLSPAKPSCDLGPDGLGWLLAQQADGGDATPGSSLRARSGGRRSLSYSAAPAASMPALPTSPTRSMPSPIPSPYAAGSAHQAALANALIAASHAEAARGVHPDLLQILNHGGRPWGFAYAGYPHRVRVWYGTRDEKIAEHAVRWMERAMGPARCRVEVVPGADHALMYNSAVVVQALEAVADAWAQ